MIFWFSGTGNSLYAAKELSDLLGQKMYDIADMIKKRRYVFSVGEKETMGFVFPVYFGGLPEPVRHFLSKLRLEDNPSPYTYAVITNGGTPSGCDRMLKKALDERRIRLHCIFDLPMPDNYILLYNPTPPSEQKKLAAQADQKINQIAMLIEHRKRKGYKSKLTGRLATKMLYPFYVHGRRTDKFYADFKCIGCGQCVRNCPCGAIEMYKGKPRWIKKQCAHCLKCLNACPVKALQYGKKTVNRLRYVHECMKTEGVDKL